MRVVCLSDTHGLTEGLSVPDGDLLLHAGDLTMAGGLDEIASAHAFLAALPHRHKVVIAGNHDLAFERDPAVARALMTDVVYLEDAEVVVEGRRIWGSPWQPWFFDWAFNLQRGAEIRAKWEAIPAGLDVLLTHGPPLGHGDETVHGDRVGCADLLEIVRERRPRWHVFGHIHEGYGRTEADGTTFVNASICTASLAPTNPPVVFDL